MEKFDAGVCRNDEDCSTDASTDDSVLSRRGFLGATTAAVAVAGVAGCNEATNYEFEATPVGIPPDAAEELVVAELGHDSQTRTFDLEVGEVSITNYGASYHRGRARGQPTLMEAFAGQVNGTEGAGASRLISGSDIAQANFGPLLDLLSGSVSPDRVSLLVPAGAVTDAGGESEDGERVGEITPENVLIVVTLQPETELPEDIGDLYGVALNDLVPNRNWDEAATTFDPDETQPFIQTEVQPLSDEAKIVTSERPFEDVFGQPPEAFRASSYPNIGEASVDENSLLVMPGDVAIPDMDSFAVPDPDSFAVSPPAPMGGATFGLAALATPRAEVAGEARNPWATEDLETLLEPSDGQEILLEGTGVSEADDIRWLAGPEEVFNSTGYGVFDGQEPTIRTFTGIVNSREDTEVNWLIGLHLARVEHDDDAVIAGGSHRTWVEPGTPVPDHQRFLDIDGVPQWITGGAELTAACFERLATREEWS